jgi:hypothetical protein
MLNYLALTESRLDDFWNDDNWKVDLTSDGLMLAFGVWLTFGSRGIVRLILWARSAAKPAPSAADEPPQSSLPPST